MGKTFLSWVCYHLTRQRKRYINPYHKSYHPLSISDAWLDFTLWVKEVFLWITGLKIDPTVFEDNNEAQKQLHIYIPKQIDLDRPSLFWVNHSTFYAEYCGFGLLTDPVWSKRCGPLSGIGPCRQHSSGLKIDSLGNLNLILLSHNHYDHLDEKTVWSLKRLYPNLMWLLPKGCKDWFKRRGICNVIELSWWEEHRLCFGKNEIKITAVPAQHFSGRGLLDVNDTLWVGWIVEFFQGSWREKVLYFVGDTGYNPIDFREIGRRFAPIDLSLIPIGAYLPRKIMSTIHINPYEALLIHKEVDSQLSVACHHLTFALAQDTLSQPSFDLMRALKEQKLSPEKFLVPKPGDCINW